MGLGSHLWVRSVDAGGGLQLGDRAVARGLRQQTGVIFLLELAPI